MTTFIERLVEQLDIVVVATGGLVLLFVGAAALIYAIAGAGEARDRAERNLRADRAAERRHRTWNADEGGAP